MYKVFCFFQPMGPSASRPEVDFALFYYIILFAGLKSIPIVFLTNAFLSVAKLSKF